MASSLIRSTTALRLRDSLLHKSASKPCFSWRLPMGYRRWKSRCQQNQNRLANIEQSNTGCLIAVVAKATLLCWCICDDTVRGWPTWGRSYQADRRPSSLFQIHVGAGYETYESNSVLSGDHGDGANGRHNLGPAKRERRISRGRRPVRRLWKQPGDYR